MKNKIKTIASALSVAVLTFPAMAMAQFSIPKDTNLADSSIADIITNFMQWILGLVGVIGIIGFAISGILYLTSAGDETRIDSAKRAMTYSIIGVIVALVGLVAVVAINSMLDARKGF